jgi:hypothetical protein
MQWMAGMRRRRFHELRLPRAGRAEQLGIKPWMPFKQSQPAQILSVQFQNGGQSREFVQFHAASAVFPQAHALWLDMQLLGHLRLLQPQCRSATFYKLRKQYTVIVRFVHGCCPSEFACRAQAEECRLKPRHNVDGIPEGVQYESQGFTHAVRSSYLWLAGSGTTSEYNM